MAGETEITITGNLTADPELRTTNNGGIVASFTIANTPRRYNRQSQQWEDGDPLFMRCSAWDSKSRPLASNIHASLAKGMAVVATGVMRQRSYESNNGEKRTVIELTVNDIGPSLGRATAEVRRQGMQSSQSQRQQSVQGDAFAMQSSSNRQQQGQTVTAFGASTDPWGEFGVEPEF